MLWFAIVFLTIDAGLLAVMAKARGNKLKTAYEAEKSQMAEVLVDNFLIADPDWTSEQPGMPDELAELVPKDAGFVAVVVRDPQGAVMGYTGLDDPQALPFLKNYETVSAGPVTDKILELRQEEARALFGDPRRLLLFTIPFTRSADPLICYLQVVVLDFSEVAPSLALYKDLIILGVPIGGTIALIAAWLIAGRVVAPIEQMAQAARSVRPDRIGERIRVDSSTHEIVNLQDELNEALSRLELGYRAQERFISDVSHELRTPLAVLLAEASLVRASGSKPARHEAFLASTEEELRRLARLVEGFLRLTRVEMMREPLLTDEVPVNDLILDATRHVEPYARRAGVHLIPRLAPPDEDGDGPIVRGDPELLRTMLENLMRNAVRFSPTGAPVEIDVAPEPGDAADPAASPRVRLSVRDHGPGIPPENLERVFQRFVRLEQAGEREKGGAGIGLSIARNVAVLHGGDIRATNSEQGGCVMTVRLPLGKPDHLEETRVMQPRQQALEPQQESGEQAESA